MPGPVHVVRAVVMPVVTVVVVLHRAVVLRGWAGGFGLKYAAGEQPKEDHQRYIALQGRRRTRTIGDQNASNRSEFQNVALMSSNTKPRTSTKTIWWPQADSNRRPGLERAVPHSHIQRVRWRRCATAVQAIER